MGSFGNEGGSDGQFDNPTGISVDGNGIIVADYNNHRLQRFTLSGVFDCAYGRKGTGPGEFHYPFGVTLAGRLLFISEDGGGRLQVLDRGTFEPLLQFTPDQPASCGVLKHMSITTDGGLLVCDIGCHCVHTLGGFAAAALALVSDGLGPDCGPKRMDDLDLKQDDLIEKHLDAMKTQETMTAHWQAEVALPASYMQAGA